MDIFLCMTAKRKIEYFSGHKTSNRITFDMKLYGIIMEIHREAFASKKCHAMFRVNPSMTTGDGK